MTTTTITCPTPDCAGEPRRELVYGSVCSGIEAASCAWEPLGFRPAWFAEIASFQSRLLAAKWPHVPNHCDFTTIGPQHGAVDILVGGTPCQSFSVAGERAGLDDPRGHLAIEFLRLARRLGARWVVWENVPGVLSADGGDAFATFVRLMVECGYGVAWRILDAQFFGVPQRRRRVFVVGHLGDWRPSVAVLLERPSLQRDPRASGPKGTSVAAPPGIGADRGVAHTLTAHHGRNSGEDVFALTFSSHERTPLISSSGAIGVLSFDQAQITSGANRATVAPDAPAPTMTRSSRTTVAGPLHPRRLTPREVERCFGFPDDWTLIKGASDSIRYEALGNSMAVPVVAWIGRRLKAVDELVRRA